MRALYLVRHAAVAVSAGVCYGRSDIALTELPQKYAKSLQLRLPRDAHIVSSPLSRCRLLAECLGDATLDARLAEMDFGDWEGQPFDTLPREQIDAWALTPLDFTPPGGESGAQVITRVLAALDDVLARAGDAVIVSHGGPLRIITGYLLGFPREAWLQQDMPIGSLRVLQQHGAISGWALVTAP